MYHYKSDISRSSHEDAELEYQYILAEIQSAEIKWLTTWSNEERIRLHRELDRLSKMLEGILDRRSINSNLSCKYDSL